MDNNELIEKYKENFSCEIEENKLLAQDFIDNGVSEFTLLSEIFLKKKYGDMIILDKENEMTEVDTTKKVVQKIDLTELNKMSALSKHIEDISKSNFDKNLEILLQKLK